MICRSKGSYHLNSFWGHFETNIPNFGGRNGSKVPLYGFNNISSSLIFALSDLGGCVFLFFDICIK